MQTTQEQEEQADRALAESMIGHTIVRGPPDAGWAGIHLDDGRIISFVAVGYDDPDVVIESEDSWDVPEVARRLRVDAATVQCWADTGFLPSYRLPSGPRRFLPGDVRQFKDRLRYLERKRRKESA